MPHVLVLSTLYPNPANPRFGAFVARSMENLASRTHWTVSVINPLGLPPLGIGGLSSRYRGLMDLPEEAEEGGIAVHRPRFTLIPRIGARRNPDAVASAALPIARAIHADTPVDLVDAQFFFPDGPAAAILARSLGKPLSIKARGSDITYWSRFDFARKAMREAAQQASGLFAVSAALADEAAARLGVERSGFTVHHTGLDRDRFRPFGHTQLRAQLSRELGFALPDAAPILASVGALIKRKGHHIAIEALTRLPPEHSDARLLVVGKGEEEATLRNLASELGLAERVHFTGSVDHDLLPLLLSAADIMVLPTANEGLANVWVEALACGTPVVTCDVGGARDVIASRVAGRLVERTPAAVAAGVEAVLSDPPDPQAVAAIAERFDWTAHAHELAARYDQLIA